MRKWLAMLMALAAIGLVAAGCGGDDEDGGGDAAATTEQPAPADTGAADTGAADTGEDTGGAADGSTVELSSPADGSLEYDTTQLTAQAGEVTIEYTNRSEAVPHNVTLEEPQEATDTVTGETTSLTAELEPGEYTFFCSVAGHRQAGMEGTLSVE